MAYRYKQYIEINGWLNYQSLKVNINRTKDLMGFCSDLTIVESNENAAKTDG